MPILLAQKKRFFRIKIELGWEPHVTPPESRMFPILRYLSSLLNYETVYMGYEPLLGVKSFMKFKKIPYHRCR